MIDSTYLARVVILVAAIGLSATTAMTVLILLAIRDSAKHIKEGLDNMATKEQELKDAIAALGTKISDGLGAVQTSLAAEVTAVTDALTAAQGSGDTIPTSDLQPMIDSLVSLGTSVDTNLGGLKDSIDQETAALTAPKGGQTTGDGTSQV